MKKQQKNILIALAALVFLGAVAAVLMLTGVPAEEPEEDTSSTVSTLTEKVLDYTIDDIASIDFNSYVLDEEFTLIPTKLNDDVETNTTFTIQGWEDEDVITSSALGLAQRFYSMICLKEIGQVDDLAEYGLSGNGEYKGVLHFTDGTDKTVIVGIEAGETAGRYVLVDGTVSIASFGTYLGYSKYNYINTSNLITIEDPSEENVTDIAQTISTLDHLYLTGTNFPEDIRIEYEEKSILVYAMVTPIYAGMNTNVAESVIDKFQSVSATGVVAVKATEAEYAEFGLDEPSAVADYSVNGERHVITLGKKHAGAYYATIDDSDVIYTLNADDVSEWAEADVFTLRDGFIALPTIMNVERLTVESADSTEVYNVTREVDEKRTTESSTVYNYFPTLNGQEISYEKSYQPFYRNMIAIYTLHEDVREPDGDALLRLKFEFFDDSEPLEIVYYADSAERRCTATLNGRPSGVVRYSEVESLLNLKPKLANNENLKD